MLRASGGRERLADDTTRSPTRISPAVGSTKPAIRRKVVVLPQPDGPSRQTNRPWSIRNDTSSTTANASYRLVKFRSSTDATQVLLMLPPPLAGGSGVGVARGGTALPQPPDPHPIPPPAETACTRVSATQ